MTVCQLIKVLQELDPDLQVLYVQNTGIIAPVKSVQEVSYKGLGSDSFVGICCGNRIERPDVYANPIYISQKKQSL